MARNVTAEVLAEIQAALKRPVIFYEGVFTTGTLRLWSGIGQMSWNGQVWTGAGSLLEISGIEETGEIRAVNFNVSLNGESSALLALNLGAARQGLAGRVWLGFLNTSNELIADPFKAFQGRLDVPDIVRDGAQCRISVRYESRLIALTRPIERRYTPEDQAIEYSGDKGFDQVAQLQDVQIIWQRL